MNYPLSQNEVVERVNAALAVFLERDIYLLEHDVNERTITHKLAEYLQDEFEYWNVDCEYNRNGHEPKRVGLAAENGAEKIRYVSTYPDIIVHRRGNNDNNLLIVEAKKENDRRAQGEEHDRHKLLAYLRDLNYCAGLFIIFFIGSSSETQPFKCEFFFDNGRVVCEF